LPESNNLPAHTIAQVIKYEQNIPEQTARFYAITDTLAVKLFSTEKELRKQFGPRMTRVIQRRLMQLFAAESLEDLRGAPGRLHELTGDRAGQFAMDLVHPGRLIFIPAGDDGSELRKPDGGWNWSRIARVIVIEAADYH
jgi:plasmid maintenance system killer protein